MSATHAMGLRLTHAGRLAPFPSPQYTITLTAVTPGPNSRSFAAKNTIKIRTPGIGWVLLWLVKPPGGQTMLVPSHLMLAVESCACRRACCLPLAAAAGATPAFTTHTHTTQGCTDPHG